YTRAPEGSDCNRARVVAARSLVPCPPHPANPSNRTTATATLQSLTVTNQSQHSRKVPSSHGRASSHHARGERDCAIDLPALTLVAVLTPFFAGWRIPCAGEYAVFARVGMRMKRRFRTPTPAS